MVAIHLVAIGVAAIGLVTSIVRVIRIEVEKHKARKPLLQDNSLVSNDKSIILTAHVLINGRSYQFVKESNQIFAHYDLAIDYCINHAQELGLTVDNIKSCIYPLSNILNQEFEEMIPKNKEEIAINNERLPKELTLDIPRINDANLTSGNRTINQIQDSLPTNQATTEVESLLQTESKASKLQRLTLEINAINYIFEFRVDQDSISASQELANQFCLLKGKEILKAYLVYHKLNTESQVTEALHEKCYRPVHDALLMRIEEIKKSKFSA